MKKVFTVLSIILLTVTVWAQSPNKLIYQAVVRNSSNQLVTSHAVGIKISILQGSASGAAVYVETQAPTSNTNGLIDIIIGSGTVQSGDIAKIDWSSGPYYLKTEIDPSGGVSYTVSGATQILSTPYALYSNVAAKTSKNRISLNVFGSHLGGSAIFGTGFGVNAGLSCPSGSMSSFDENFTVPDDYTAGDTLFVKMIMVSTSTGVTNLFANYISFARVGSYETGGSASSGLNIPAVNFTAANTPIEIDAYIVSPSGSTTILPGDAISFGLFRTASDANSGTLRIHSIEILYK